ncbi:hypothetical protein [Pseudarthrobacter chlorophenolicus]|uniref:hypothetical protein n=1 Tax=Pseudarthrobacter chlorophenolicus TaxID=85085 RepID=UPI00126A2809|nr:hypothetical protein [Pseudarthrobacter chlorophenolicus]
MQHKVKVREVHKNERDEIGPQDRPPYISLEQLVSSFGGYEFNLELSDGTKVPVSVRQFMGRDPRTTFLRVEVESRPENEKESAEFDARAQARHGKK